MSDARSAKDVELRDLVNGGTAEKPLTLLGHLSILCANVLPSTVLIGCFSAVGYGPEIVGAVSPYSVIGNVALVLAALLVVWCYVLDLPNWDPTARLAVLTVPWILVMAGFVLKVSYQPSYIMALTTFHVVILLGVLRGSSCRDVGRRQFYVVVACIALLCAVASAGIWLTWWSSGNDWSEGTRNGLAGRAAHLYETVYSPARFEARPLSYTRDCGQSRNITAFSSEEQAEIAAACAQAATVLYVMWACPLIVTIGSLVLVLFIGIIGLNSRLENARDTERLLKIWLFGLILVGMGNYASAAYFSGVSVRLGSTLAAFFAVAFISILMWFCLEHHWDISGLKPDLTQSKFIQYIPPWVWNVVRGMVIGGLNVMIPLFLLADMARRHVQKLKELKVHGSAARDPHFTWWGLQLMAQLRTVRWANTLWWVCTLGHVYFVWQVGVAKATYIFFSWLNSQLSTMPFGQVLVINFMVGIVMFLLPPVPGVAVYLFTGIVVAEQGRQNPSIGFVLGCVIAIALTFALKLMACCAQYALGYTMGQSVKVQALVGVDKPFTRAMEVILKEPGISFGKVSVLVGGPDWPVSVGCGILRVNLLQMMLGTAPVIGVVAPCVLAGAFQASTGRGEGSFFSMGATLLTSVSVVIQMGTGLAAVISVMNVVGDRGEELARPREEHKAVEALARQEEQYRNAFQEATEWGNLPCADRALLSVAAALSVSSGAIFAFYGSSCFENFSISSKIDDPLDESGLGGDVLNIVILPQGAVPLVLYAMSAALHLAYVLETSRLATARLRRGPGAPSPVMFGKPVETE
mmetsp:Transcript_85437/g.242303  ORF Transcript_85437/g.242303 Transcript_85437/m.242303 type:complete len:806 (-) Transcript_85437:14-2431(-)